MGAPATPSGSRESSPAVSTLTGFDPSRVERLLHPTRGVLRGIINYTEPGKGGPDDDGKLISIRVGELREIDAALRWMWGQVL